MTVTGSPVSILHRARFTISAARLDQLPEPTGPEVCFVGRSNAGKSSAINVLTNQRRLAFSSKTPDVPPDRMFAFSDRLIPKAFLAISSTFPAMAMPRSPTLHAKSGRTFWAATCTNDHRWLVWYYCWISGAALRRSTAAWPIGLRRVAYRFWPSSPRPTNCPMANAFEQWPTSRKNLPT